MNHMKYFMPTNVNEWSKSFNWTTNHIANRHIHSLTFLYETESLTIFTKRNFWNNAYFWQRSALKWICFVIFIHFIISKMAVWTKRDVCLHSACSSALVLTDAVFNGSHYWHSSPCTWFLVSHPAVQTPTTLCHPGTFYAMF